MEELEILNIEKKPKKSTEVKGVITSVILIFVLLLLICYLIFFSNPIKVEGDSMLPLINEETKDYVVLLKHGYKLDYNDLVVFNRDGGKVPPIKRVVGKEGDTVQIKNGYLYRNDVKVEEAYVDAENRGNIFTDEHYNTELYTISPGCIYLLGDNRKFSMDSRTYGEINERNVVGKVIFLYGKGKTLFLGG